jgi:hypothetical protein
MLSSTVSSTIITVMGLVLHVRTKSGNENKEAEEKKKK